MNRFAGDRIDPGAADRKALFFVEADGACVVGVDVEVESAWRESLSFCDEARPDIRSPQLRGHYDLVEIERVGIDGDESGDPIFAFGDYDGRRGQ